MNIRRGIVSLGVASSVLLAGSTKNVTTCKIPAANKNIPTLQLKPTLMLDSIKFRTIDAMDDGPVLPRYRGK